MPLDNRDQVLRRAGDVLEQRMGKAVAWTVGYVKVSINRGNADGKNPSKPGEPPKKVSGLLFSKIAGVVVRTRTEVLGFVGANVVYARRLELGFVGRDRTGANIDQKPRPFLRPAVARNWARLQQILNDG